MQQEIIELDGPMVRVFHMSDYRSGCMDAVATSTGLYRRATLGGRPIGRLTPYQPDFRLLTPSSYSEDVIHAAWKKYDEEDFALRYTASHTVLSRLREERRGIEKALLGECTSSVGWP